MTHFKINAFLLGAILWCCAPLLLLAQPNKAPKQSNKANALLDIDPSLFSSLKWRNIGTYRGGRCAAVAGVKGKPNLFYMGATGGGVWRTKDGGSNWENISDHYFGGSIGAVAVSESDPNVLYVGGGESTLRGNMSFGYGVYKSLDAGKSWAAVGLDKSRQIAQIRIHPQNPDIVYVAVIGNAFAPSKERGIYKSVDGGKNWKNVLFVNEQTGAADLILDPTNARIMYATTWRVQRQAHTFESGGEGSHIWKSTNGGETWVCLTDPNYKPTTNTNATLTAPNSANKIKSKPTNGLPEAPLGISCVSLSAANPDRIWAMVEAKDGGLYRSDDAGNTWRKINNENYLKQRAWYFSRIVADPTNADRLYALNVNLHVSKDGGKSFEVIHTPHVDHHDMWIDANDPLRMIVGDDGGAQISFDGGINWSSCENQPTSQYYRLSTDNHFPYRILAAQQDNSAVRISHLSNGRAESRDWEDTAGGESGYIVADPNNPDIVYGGSYGGYFTQYNHKTEQERAINIYPDNPMGHGAIDFKYRFQWNFPIFFSPHNPKKLYAASNHLHATTNEGHEWTVISPDLTRNDSTKLQASGGAITKDNTSVEYYCTIFTAAESPRVKDLIWTGSDDGLIHVTRNGGETWQNVTPPDLPKWIMINCIEPDPHHDGGAYFAATAYKSGNFEPYLYKTTDFGKTWTKIIKGIAAEHFTRTIRCDPTRAGLLYAGTETGMYVSFNDGNTWQPLQLNLPIVPITDLHIKGNDLIAATQGRGIWLIDHLEVLRAVQNNIAAQPFYLYQPPNIYYGNYAPIYYYINPKTDTTQTITLSFWTANDSLVRFYTNQTDKFSLKNVANKATIITAKDNKANSNAPKNTSEVQQLLDRYKQYQKSHKVTPDKLTVNDSCNVFAWNAAYPNAKSNEKSVMWWASTSGAKIIPGKYTVKMTLGEQITQQQFEVKQDPRSTSTETDYQQRLLFLQTINEKVSHAHETIKQIGELKRQLNEYKNKLSEDTIYKPISQLIKQIDSTATVIEENLHQPKNKSGQDPINYPIKLNNKLAHLKTLANIGNSPPTLSMQQVYDDLSKDIDAQIAQFKAIKTEQLPKLNELIRNANIDFIWLKE
jgi:photosystem II stability/assembly factor-like uncharacterized protein